MRFQASGNFLAGQADVDPVAAPATILVGHMMAPKRSVTKEPASLDIILLGTGGETLTLDLYFLVEDKDIPATIGDYVSSASRWFQFATGQVVTNGTLLKVTAGLPAGGVMYARRTADTITGGQTRPLYMAWVND